MRRLPFFFGFLLLAGCPPESRTASHGGFGADEAPTPPPASSTAPAQTLPDVSRCFADVPRRGWVKLRVHLMADGRVEKVEDEGSTAEVHATECAMRVVSAGAFAPCTGCGKYELHVEIEAAGPAPIPAEEGDAGAGIEIEPAPPAEAPPAADAGRGPDETWM